MLGNKYKIMTKKINIKNLLIKMIFISMLLMVAILFSACSEVRAMTITNEDGSIDQLVYVELDSETITEAGYDISEVKDDISRTSRNEARSLLDNFALRIQSDILISDDETRLILLSYLQGLTVVGDTWQGNSYVIGLRFENIDIYNYYYRISDNSEPEYQVDSHFFYDEISYTGQSLYLTYNDLYDNLSEYFSEKYSSAISLKDPSVLFTYVSDSGREHSNADMISESENKYYHTWELSSDINREIRLYYNIANRANCILVCILASVAVVGILLLSGFIVEKIKKKKAK